MRFAYRAVDGAETRRRVDPHRLVSAGRRWYLVAYDHERDDWRIFRGDRVDQPRATGARAVPRELPAENAADYLIDKLYGLAPSYKAVATLHLPAEQVRGRLGDNPDDVVPIDEHSCLLRSHTDTLEYLASRLAMLGCEFEVHEPPELADYLRAMAERVANAVRR